MANPLDGLKKATGIGPAPPAEFEGVRNAIDSGVEGVKGFLGFGQDTQANKLGQLVSAGAPLLGSISEATHPAVQELLRLLDAEPRGISPTRSLLMSKATPYKLPQPDQLTVPDGFDLPDTFNPQPVTAHSAREAGLMQDGYGTFGRSPMNDERYRQQQDSFQKLMPAKPQYQAVKSIDELRDIVPAGPARRVSPPLTGKFWSGNRATAREPLNLK